MNINGLYGTVRPAGIDITKDVEMFYRYRPSRSTTDEDYTEFKVLENNCLEKVSGTNSEGSSINILGMYNLRLPLNIFNLKGFYTIYIRPKETLVSLFDTGILAIDNSVKGVVLQSSEMNGETDLTGYRLEYVDDNEERTGVIRLITSCNGCEPMSTSLTTSIAKSNTYRLVSSTGASNLYFCTVTPSTAPSYKPNYAPYIGQSGTKAWLCNTKFNPVMLEIEMVEHDNDTLSYAIEGDQVRDRDNSIITQYTDDNEIYKQYDYYTVKDKLGKPLRDVKVHRTDIDGSQVYDNVITPGETE